MNVPLIFQLSLDCSVAFSFCRKVISRSMIVTSEFDEAIPLMALMVSQ